MVVIIPGKLDAEMGGAMISIKEKSTKVEKTLLIYCKKKLVKEKKLHK
jgi:hypothetical protein